MGSCGPAVGMGRGRKGGEGNETQGLTECGVSKSHWESGLLGMKPSSFLAVPQPRRTLAGWLVLTER